MRNTKIEWCDSTWNPVTGCLHGCEYCYAARLANRFKNPGTKIGENVAGIILDKPFRGQDGANGEIKPYPFGFTPTFHRYRLDMPKKIKEPENIFVCSMADLWGSWVNTNWKIEVMEACTQAPQHRYLFLTKNPFGYNVWPTVEHPNFDDVSWRTSNIWLGVTYTGTERRPGAVGHIRPLSIDTNFWYHWRMSRTITPGYHHTFLSIEPMACDICEVKDEREGEKLLEHIIGGNRLYEWVIIGAETGNRKEKVTPKKEWIDKLVDLCDRNEIPVFMKDSLLSIMGSENMRREFPWDKVEPVQQAGADYLTPCGYVSLRKEAQN